MATKMNSNTHKVIVATYYAPETIYAVPIDWNVKDITIRHGTVYYKGTEVELESIEIEDSKYPSTIEETDTYDLEDYFECEEEEEENEDHSEDMKEVIGEFTICDNLELFKSDFPRKEFKELEKELEMDGFLECFIHEPKEKATLPEWYSEISISFGSNKRVIRTSYNSSSPFALWLCGIDIHYYAESDSESEEDEEVRCVCPKCFAEGYTFVSKERAKELEEMEELEEMCPFGEKCNGEEDEE